MTSPVVTGARGVVTSVVLAVTLTSASAVAPTPVGLLLLPVVAAVAVPAILGTR